MPWEKRDPVTEDCRSAHTFCGENARSGGGSAYQRPGVMSGGGGIVAVTGALPSVPVAPTYPQLFNRAWVVQRWVIEQRTGATSPVRWVVIPNWSRWPWHCSGCSAASGGRHRQPQPALQSKRNLAALYAEHGSMMKVAQHLHCDQDAVREAMDRHGISRRVYATQTDRQWFVDALAWASPSARWPPSGTATGGLSIRHSGGSDCPGRAGPSPPVAPTFLS
jgi:hypothetical protein